MAVVDPEARRRRSKIGFMLESAAPAVLVAIAYVSDWAQSGVGVPKHFVLKWAIGAIDRNSTPLISVAFIALLAGKLLSREGRRQRLRAIQALLDTMKASVFPDCSDALESDHRVTLFKWQRFCWAGRSYPERIHVLDVRFWRWPYSPREGWLLPHLRSGVFGKGVSGSIFLAPKEDVARADGMAGRAWTMPDLVMVTKLPEIHAGSAQARITRYAQRTFTSESFIRAYIAKKRPLPRCLVGFRVETSSGDAWGSIVIDSRKPDAIDRDKVLAAFELIRKPLGVLLEA